MKAKQDGYTLIEVILAMFLFSAIAIPMLCAVISNSDAMRSQESLTAAYLLEQEAMRVRLFPEDAAPIVHRTLDGKAWTVEIKADGTPLVKYELMAIKKNRNCGRAIVYAYQKK
jgi:prepilin-type N-terminal cleavage/methylation domain-containing protein